MNTTTTLTALVAALAIGCGGQQVDTDPAPTAVPDGPMAPVAETTPTETVDDRSDRPLDPAAREAQLRITRAEAALVDARQVGADRHAPTLYGHAAQALEAARTWSSVGRHLESISRADEAFRTAIQAHRQAHPEQIEARLEAMQSERQRSLVLDLTASTAATPRVTDAGIEVPVLGAFLPKADELSAIGATRLAQIGDVAKKYSDYRVEVVAAQPELESATDALVLGQSRGVTAAGRIEAQGIAAGRVQGTGSTELVGRRAIVRFVPPSYTAIE